MKKKIVFVLFTFISLCYFAGCVSTRGLSPSKVKTAAKNDEYGSPADHALLFSYGVVWNDFLQQNPELGYKFYDANLYESSHTIIFVTISQNIGFLEPLPVGSELKLFSDTGYIGNTRQTTYYGISGVDVVLNKPGLFYWGDDNEKHKNEQKALKMLLKYFKGTDSEWEQLILSRMEEIKNAK